MGDVLVVVGQVLRPCRSAGGLGHHLVVGRETILLEAALAQILLQSGRHGHRSRVAGRLPLEHVAVLLVDVQLHEVVVISAAVACPDAEDAVLGEVDAVGRAVGGECVVGHVLDVHVSVVQCRHRTDDVGGIGIDGQRVGILDGARQGVDFHHVIASRNGLLLAIDIAVQGSQRKAVDDGIAVERCRPCVLIRLTGGQQQDCCQQAVYRRFLLHSSCYKSKISCKFTHNSSILSIFLPFIKLNIG